MTSKSVLMQEAKHSMAMTQEREQQERQDQIGRDARERHTRQVDWEQEMHDRADLLANGDYPFGQGVRFPWS